MPYIHINRTSETIHHCNGIIMTTNSVVCICAYILDDSVRMLMSKKREVKEKGRFGSCYQIEISLSLTFDCVHA
jgi:hypothetical protein